MLDAFSTCLAATLEEEGGFSNDPKDPGGVTMRGVTKRAWEAWIGHPVSVDDMRALTVPRITPFYRTQYWLPIGGDRLPVWLAMCVFDFAVNSGPGRAAMELQHVVGAMADGHIGDTTRKDLAAFVKVAGVKGTIAAYQRARAAYLRALPEFPHDGGGWLARVETISQRATATEALV